MLAALRRLNLKPLVAALYAVAMLTLGFAHLPIASTDSTSPAFAASALPDGTPIKICGQTPDAPAGKHVCKSCDACRLTAAAGLVLAPPLSVEAADRSTLLPLALALMSPAKAAALEPQSRGPPGA